MAACGVPFEVLDNAELARRFPQFRFGENHTVDVAFCVDAIDNGKQTGAGVRQTGR